VGEKGGSASALPANLAFNQQLSLNEIMKAPTSLDADTTIRNLPQATGWALDGGKVCADNIALSHEADCPSPDVKTNCALAIDSAAGFVTSDEEQEKFAEMSGTPECFQKASGFVS